MQSGLHEHETAPQQQQLVDCLCKTLAVLYQNFTQHLVKLSLSLSTHNLLLCNNKMGLGEISKWAEWVFF
jgi:hypothetical protein